MFYKTLKIKSSFIKLKIQPHQVSAWCSVGTADEKQDAGSPGKALHTYQPLDFIRAVISFTVTGDACLYHRTLRNAVVVGGRLEAPPRWRLYQSECRRDVLFYAR